MDWINARDRRPSVGEEVIVAICDDSGDSPRRYTTSGWYTGDAIAKWVVDNEFNTMVTHWAPFPRYPN